MIKIVFFDVGGVLVRDDAARVLRRQARVLAVPFPALIRDLRPDRVLLMKGAITRREYLYRLARRFDLPPIRVGDLRPLVPPRRSIAGTWAITRRLRARGQRIGLITNLVPPLPFGQRLRLPRYFRPVVRSYQVGSVKPERRIYEIARRRAGVKFGEMAFFDDRMRNVRAARKLGIHAFLYKNPAGIMRSLRRLGIDV